MGGAVLVRLVSYSTSRHKSDRRSADSPHLLQGLAHGNLVLVATGGLSLEENFQSLERGYHGTIYGASNTASTELSDHRLADKQTQVVRWPRGQRRDGPGQRAQGQKVMPATTFSRPRFVWAGWGKATKLLTRTKKLVMSLWRRTCVGVRGSANPQICGRTRNLLWSFRRRPISTARVGRAQQLLTR